MIYFAFSEDYSWCPPSFRFGEGGEVMGSVFRDAGEEGIGEFSIIDHD